MTLIYKCLIWECEHNNDICHLKHYFKIIVQNCFQNILSDFKGGTFIRRVQSSWAPRQPRAPAWVARCSTNASKRWDCRRLSNNSQGSTTISRKQLLHAVLHSPVSCVFTFVLVLVPRAVTNSLVNISVLRSTFYYTSLHWN